MLHLVEHPSFIVESIIPNQPNDRQKMPILTATDHQSGGGKVLFLFLFQGKKLSQKMPFLTIFHNSICVHLSKVVTTSSLSL